MLNTQLTFFLGLESKTIKDDDGDGHSILNVRASLVRPMSNL
jgi:nitrogen fixation-related uncharacterized protein